MLTRGEPQNGFLATDGHSSVEGTSQVLAPVKTKYDVDCIIVSLYLSATISQREYLSRARLKTREMR
jgi:hypothetical protein